MTREQLFPGASLNLNRYRDYQRRIAVYFLLCGLGFLIAGLTMDAEVMPAEIYGSAIARYPAEWWSASVVLACGAFLLGVRINGAWRWSPALRSSGAALHCAILCTLIVTSWGSIGGPVILMFGGTSLLIWTQLLLWSAADLIRAMGRPHADR